MDPRVGTEFAGHRIEQVIGRGGASVVYLAEHLRLGRRVALKVLAPHLADDEAFRERFIRESRIAAGLDHPSIVTVYDAGEVDGSLFISMRYVEGSDLGKLLEAVGTLEPTRTIAILSQVASALDAAHLQGLVHRDVKPGNILVEPASGGFDRAYLSDFGISKRTTSREGLTRTGQFVGTVDYVAPEQITGEPIDGRTDVYSLGCVLYRCLAGRVPFPGQTEVATIYSHLHDPPPGLEGVVEPPDVLDQVVATALAKAKEDRFDTCGALVESARSGLTAMNATTALARPQRVEPDTEPPAGGATKVPEPRRRPAHRAGGGRRRVAMLSAGAVVVAAAVVALVLALPGDGTEPGGSTGPTGSTGEETGPTGPTAVEDPPSFVWTPAYRTEGSGLAGAAIIDAVEVDGVVLAVGHATPEGQPSALDDAAVWRSENGRQWHRVGQRSLGEAGDQRMISVVDLRGRLVAAGWSDSDAAVWTSTDLGETWTRSEAPELAAVGLQRIRDLVPFGSEVVAVGSNGLPQQQDAAVWTSADGLEWDLVDSPAFAAPGDQEVFAVRAVGERLVAVGITDELDGIDGAVWVFEAGGWRRVPPESLAAPDHQVMLDVAGGGGDLPLVAVGCEDPGFRCDTRSAASSDAVVWMSQDGSSWERVPAQGRLAGAGEQVMRAVVTYRGALVAVGSIGGPLGDIDGGAWASVDGITWQAPAQSNPNVTALGGRGDQSLRAIVVYRRHGITLFGFGVTQEADTLDGGVWGARELGG